MNSRHLDVWPKVLPQHLHIPQTNLFFNVEVAAARFPDKPFLIFYDGTLSFGAFKREAEAIAGFLQRRCGIQAGDRVLLDMQNSPQFVLAYYGILRAGGVVVPVNPMNLTLELAHYVNDSGAKAAFVGQELFAQMRPLLGEGLKHIIVAAYSDYVAECPHIAVPSFVAAARENLTEPNVTLWVDMLAEQHAPGHLSTGPSDLCVMPYTSGTTGRPKGCMHTHHSVMSTAVGGIEWVRMPQDTVVLAVLPFFHVTGMQMSMNGPLYNGNTVVLLPRWDRDAAAACVQRYKVGSWQAISTMVVDFLMNPRIADYDLSSVWNMGGGGAAMPEAVAQKLHDLCGITYMEGYGMTETMAPSHINPLDRPKRQCLGIPIFDVDARVIDPQTLRVLPAGEVGEIVVHGPQVMQGYWGQPTATEEAFVTQDGKRFLRTGDLGRVDEEGYFFMVDRLKRMINASGYKVWPAEVESMMYQHPDIAEACVVGAVDAKRGETVKAYVVLKPQARGEVSEQSIVDWAHEHMAAYKSPRIVEFVDSLPKSGTGKVQWRALQEREAQRQQAAP
ncbi:long-chain fatty acid--CoA ligase [Thiomonas sp. FB-Cd]|uniref:long-chain fatty acid--CoA ligase n=1 Tax=Thiomonas sp. FB-Cd TaxID=1158292 RepID=UPI0004DFB57C|nr:long-chain fatty acid--CoA ligase [Thiomonas sp. FB-Cd]